MKQKLDLALKGLYTAPNDLSGEPEGALQLADNVVINSKNLVESRRGQTQYGNPLVIGTSQVNKIFNYSSSLILNYDSKMAYDSGDGNWVDYSGTYVAPTTEYKMRSLEAQRNFYFTTNKGVFKVDSLTANPRPAGVPKALGGTFSVTGTTGFLQENTAVAYRILWGYRDANNNLLRGAPSQRLVVSNPYNKTPANATLAVTSNITLTSTVLGTERNGATVRTLVDAASANPTDEVFVTFSGTSSAIIITITPNDGTNNGSTPVNLTTANLTELINTGGVAGKNIVLTDSGLLRELQTATGGDATDMVNGGNGDSITATFSAATDGSSYNVQLSYLIPDEITTEYFYQIYRSNATVSASDEPSDELQLVLQGNPTSGEISAKSFTITDLTPFSLMRETLYTSPSQQGIANSNNPPPFCVDMDVFKNSAFYANVKQKQTLSVALISVDSPSLGFVSKTGDITDTSTVITNIGDTSSLRVGMRAVGTGIPANTTILTIDSGAQVTLSAAATATNAAEPIEFQDRFTIGSIDYWAGSTQNVSTNTFEVEVSLTPAQNINQTALNLIEIINKSSSNTTVYAYYISALDDLPGQILFEERSIGGSAFTATSTSGGSFSPELPVSGNDVISDNDERQNVVMVSKPGEVEAVPIYRFFPIGSANFPIQRVVSLRDGIFFFKQDGIYRISGETFESFTVTLLDNTVVLQVPESAVAFNNQVFCFTTQGICAVTDSGVRIMSVPIENVLLELSSEQYTHFNSASFGVAYESSRQYMFFTVTEEDDEFATQAFVYNSLTDSWTRWIMNRTCGVVNPAVNKLFMAQADTGQVLVERKNFTNEDYADEQYTVVVDSVDSDTEITLVDATVVQPGMTLRKDGNDLYIESVDGNVITVEETAGITTGSAVVYTPIKNKITWSVIDVENPGILKQFSELTFFFKNAAFREIEAGFETNVSAGVTTVPVLNKGQGTWGTFPWGEQPWGGVLGGQIALRTYVPRDKQRASWLKLSLETNEAFTGFSLQGLSVMFNHMSSKFR